MYGERESSGRGLADMRDLRCTHSVIHTTMVLNIRLKTSPPLYHMTLNGCRTFAWQRSDKSEWSKEEPLFLVRARVNANNWYHYTSSIVNRGEGDSFHLMILMSSLLRVEIIFARAKLISKMPFLRNIHGTRVVDWSGEVWDYVPMEEVRSTYKNLHQAGVECNITACS